MRLRPAPQRSSPSAAEPERTGAGFYCQDVSRFYDSERGVVTALESVSFSVHPGEFVCIVGPSGCGKSTLLRIIAGLVEPSSGRILYQGKEGARSARGGLVVQEQGTFPWMTVLDNVAFSLEMQGVGRSERLAQAADFLDRAGLGGFARHYPYELSVGMRQRVGIGRAFVANAPLLLMDEPFGALDAQTRWALQSELLHVWSQHRKTVVFVTHDIEEAVLLGDRVLVMSGRPGRIREDIRVPLQRPRGIPRDQVVIGEISAHIWGLFEEEVRISLSIR